MHTTLNKIRQRNPCKDGWEKLLKYLGKIGPDDEPLSLLTILDSNGFDHTLWCFRAVDGFEKEKLLLAITFAREVEHLMPAESKKALDGFERYVNGLETQEEFETAREAARSAAYAAWAAADASYATAARAAAHAARAAADTADAYATASSATAICAAYAAAAAYVAASWEIAATAAARSSIKAKQETQLRQLLERTCTQL